MLKWNLSIRNEGFSLLEILIAVAILATTLVALMAAQGSAFLSSERADSLTEGVFLARQKMTDIELELNKSMDEGKFPDEMSDKSGSFDEPHDDYRWKYAVKKVEIPIVDSGKEEQNAMVGNYMQQVMDQISKSVREVKLTVYWGSKDIKEEDQPQFSVTTHIVDLTQ